MGWASKEGQQPVRMLEVTLSLDGDLPFGEDCEEFGVVLGGEGVADAFGADVDGGPDAGGASTGPPDSPAWAVRRRPAALASA